MSKNSGSWLKPPFIPHRYEMLQSRAWRARPIPLVRILERLEIEHLSHGGANNGQLTVSYSQLAAFGISRRVIKPAIVLGERLGLLEKNFMQSPQGISHGNIRPPNAYRLTYIPARGAKQPTDEWKWVTQAQANAALATYRRKTSAKK